MATVQIWFHSGFAQNAATATFCAVPVEPPLSYESETVSTSDVAVTVPAGATLAVIETDATIAYKVNSAAVYANDPIIAATSNDRYIVDVTAGAGGDNLHLIANA